MSESGSSLSAIVNSTQSVKVLTGARRLSSPNAAALLRRVGIRPRQRIRHFHPIQSFSSVWKASSPMSPLCASQKHLPRGAQRRT